MIACSERLRVRVDATLTEFAVVLCLVACSCTAHQAPPGTATSTQAAIATPPFTPTLTCTPMATGTAVPSFSPTPVSALSRLTDAQAVALIEKELAARGVGPDGMKIVVAEKPRTASIRYASSYPIDSHVFRAESVLITLAVARTVARIEPVMTGGLRLSVIPGGDGDVGLRVTIIEHSSLEAWSEGAMSDQEFVSEWTVAAVTKE